MILAQARELIILHIGEIVNQTPEIESVPFGFESQNNFLNQGIVVSTPLTPMELLRTTQDIEQQLGRDISKKGMVDNHGNRIFHDRAIDIDILYYGTQIISEGDTLTIPHSQINHRPFVIDIIRQLRW